MRHYMALTEGAATTELRFTAHDDETRAMAPGDRIVFYQVKGEGDEEKATFVAWGSVDKLAADAGEGVARIKSLTPFKLRVPFSALRADPRRNREAKVQPVAADVFNLVLSRSRR